MMLSNYTHGKDNNFNLIRFIASMAVLVSHSYAIHFGSSEYEPLTRELGRSLGSFAVDVFFITSGFLIYASLNRATYIQDYALSRVLRIFPGLIVMTALTVFVLGPITTDLSPMNYFSSLQTWEYAIKNSVLLTRVEYELPGVFTDNPLGPAVNGSLWSLPFELYMYITLPIIILVSNALFRRAQHHPSLVLASYIVISFTIRSSFDIGSLFIQKFLLLGELFFTGALIYSLRKYIPTGTQYFVLAIALATASCIFIDTNTPLLTISLSYIIIWLAYRPSGIIRKFNNFDDYSYGIYIYAFPIQQLLTFWNIADNVLSHILYSSVLTLLFAALSWRFIEKRALTLKRRITKNLTAA